MVCFLLMNCSVHLQYQAVPEFCKNLSTHIFSTYAGMLSSKTNNCFDLHGQSLKEAKSYVNTIIKEAATQRTPLVRIITGKGNHVNKDGSRGLIYKRLPNWLNELHSFIAFAEQRDGSYLVHLNLGHNLSVQRASVSCREACDKSNSLMSVIRAPTSWESKIEQLTLLVQLDRTLLHQTDNNGDNALLIAAACNQTKIIKFLIEKEATFFTYAKLLHHKNNAGNTALMIATAEGHIDTIKYLLELSPALLKKRNNASHSVFTAVSKAKNSKVVLGCLNQYLTLHKREKGYTGLFPEYKRELSRIEAHEPSDNYYHQKVKFLKGRSAPSSWFFLDRMEKFILELRKSSEEMNMHSNVEIVPETRTNSDHFAIRRLYKQLLTGDNKFRKLFLRFNNFVKPTHEKRFKHAIKPYFGIQYKNIKLSNGKTRRKRIKKSKLKKAEVRTLTSIAPIKPLATVEQKIHKEFLNRINYPMSSPCTNVTGNSSGFQKNGSNEVGKRKKKARTRRRK